MTKTYKKILACDGGGIRGALTTRIIDNIERSIPGFVKKADLIAGTSIGGVEALGFAFGKTPAEILKLFSENGDKIFQSRGLLDSITHLDEAWQANYDNKGLKGELEGIFGDAELGDLEQRVLISTFNLKTFRPEFMDSAAQRDKGILIVDAALRTSAAPTYFPSHQGFCDGGVAANNPSDCALACLQADGVDADDCVVASFGTGENPRSLSGGDWGYKDWLVHLIPLFMEGPSKAAEYRVRQALGDRQVRVQPILKRLIDLDDVEAVEELIGIADAHDLTTILEWVKTYWV